MPFISAGDGDLKSAFITDSWLIDQFVGSTMWLWGSGLGLGDNLNTSKSSPVQTVDRDTNWVSIGGCCGIKTDGTLWVWGENAAGRIGDNTTTNRSSPVQTVIGGTDWKQASSTFTASNFSGTTAAIKTDGTLWLWGNNNQGRLGDNTTTHRSSPVQTVAGGNNWLQLDVGGQSAGHTACVKTDGTLWLWGLNSFGQIGDNTATAGYSSPIQTVAGGTNWKQVSCGTNTTAAIKTDGTLWCWGNNSSGQLGDNTIVHISSPVQTVAGGTNWKQVSCGLSTTAAIKTDGTLWIWGTGSFGVLGDNTIVAKSSPVQTISGGNDWKQVFVFKSQSSVGAIKNDGSLWMWGNSILGQLGDNTTTHRSSPVQTVAGGTGWKSICAAGNIAQAVKNG